MFRNSGGIQLASPDIPLQRMQAVEFESALEAYESGDLSRRCPQHVVSRCRNLDTEHSTIRGIPTRIETSELRENRISVLQASNLWVS